RKTLDHEVKKYRLPTNAAAVEAAPPLIVGIVGPPASGKSTLLRSLIKHFGRQLVSVVTGPITVVVGKSFRITFIECDCNINSHFSKQAPTGLQKPDGDYLPAEVQRLARMMIVKTPRPTDWRTGHPYILVDRLEDITNPSILKYNSNADRTLSLYGWVRGAPLGALCSKPVVHVAGLGDYQVMECSQQPDPCPTPNQIIQSSASMEEHAGKKLKRRLTEGERRVYAPMSNIGGVLFDRDATYIDLGGSHHLGGGRLTSGRQAIQGATESELIKTRLLLSEEGTALDEKLSRDHEVRITADAPLLPGTHNGTQIAKTSGSLHGSDENVNSESEESVSAASHNDEASSDFENGSDVTDEESNGVRMFEDMVLPNSERTDDKESHISVPGRTAKFDKRHWDIKDAFDGKLVAIFYRLLFRAMINQRSSCANANDASDIPILVL
ncbi:unnamed protein product, partial [Dibothriocephalus latus]